MTFGYKQLIYCNIAGGLSTFAMWIIMMTIPFVRNLYDSTPYWSVIFPCALLYGAIGIYAETLIIKSIKSEVKKE